MPAGKGSLDSKLLWEYDVPQVSIPSVEEQQMPVMPHLESALANSLQRVRQNTRCCNDAVVDDIVCAISLSLTTDLYKHVKEQR